MTIERPADSHSTIGQYRLLIWLSLQLAVGAGGAAGALLDGLRGLIAALAMGAASLFTLHIAWRFRHREEPLKTPAEYLAALGLLAFLLLLFTANLIVALGALLVCAQLAQNLQMREYRQYYFGLMMAFVLVMAGATNARSGYYLLVFLAYGLSACFCLADLWLDSHRPGEPDPKQPGASSAHPPATRKLRVGAGVVGLALIIYVLMPRLPAANLGSWQASAPEYQTSEQWEREAGNPDQGDQPDRERAGDGAGSGDQSGEQGDAEGYSYQGFDQQFDIEQAGETGNRNSNAIVARMKAPHGSYLKMRTFDQFDGKRWSVSTRQSRKQRTERGMVELETGTRGNFRQVISIEQTLPAWLPAAPRPVQLWLPASVIALDAWGHPRLPGPLREGTEYTVDSRLQWLGNRQLGGNDPPRAPDLQIPPDLDPRITRLAHKVTRGHSGPLARAEALERHLRTEYDYSFDSIFESQGVTPLDQFLFEEKRGHCEYFASAMVIMLRSLDIPARLITGFSATQKNPLTGFYEIRALDGHAWVEAWIPNRGWLTFEPTAFYNMPRPVEETLSAEQINSYARQITRAEDAVGDDEFSLNGLIAGLWQMLYVFVVTVLGYLKLALLALWIPALIVAVGTALLYLTRSHWYPRLIAAISYGRIKSARPVNLETALPFYLYHLQRIARYKGAPRAPHEPVHYWAERVAGRFGGKDDWHHLGRVVNGILYGPAPDPTSALNALRSHALATSRQLLHAREERNPGSDS